MMLIFLTFLTSFLFLLTIKDKKESYFIISITLFYIICMLVWFHIFKFNGELILMFPDEKTYVNNDVNGGMFGIYISFLNNIISLEVQKVINLCIYIYFILYFYRSLQEKYTKLSFFLILIICSIGSYWSFFILKENFSIGGQILLLCYLKNNRKILLILGSILLLMSRPEFLFLYLCSGFFVKLYKKNKIYLVLFFLFLISIISFNFNSQYIEKIKLYSMAQRFGESKKIYDDEMLKTLNLNLYKFIKSKPYIQTLKYNISNSFNIFYLKGVAKILILLNAISFIYIVINIKKLLKKEEFYYFILPFCILILTHCTYRYMNNLMIPYMLAFCLKNQKNCEE